MYVFILVLLALAAAACGGDEPDPRHVGPDDIVHMYGPPTVQHPQLGVTRIDGSRTEQLTNLPNQVSSPAVSPDGRFVVFHQLSRLWLYDVAADSAWQFTFGPATDANARWSPDGTRLVYGSGRFASPRTYDLCIRPVAGGEANCLMGPDEYDDDGADWSPDGSEIVWRRELDGRSDLWIMNADGSNQQLLLDHSDFDTMPRWSPDGRYILFRSFRYGPPSLFILERATGIVTPVLGDSLDPAFIESGTWTPDGARIVAEVLNISNRLALIDLGTGDARFITDDTLSYHAAPSMVRGR
jgi:TolB protein